MERKDWELRQKFKWLEKLFQLDHRPITVSLEAVDDRHTLSVKDGDDTLFKASGEAEIVLDRLLAWAFRLRWYMSSGNLAVITNKKPRPTKDWKVVPEKVGIVWADDPTCNEVLLGQPWRWDDSWYLMEDPALAKDYLEDIRSLLW